MLHFLGSVQEVLDALPLGYKDVNLLLGRRSGGTEGGPCLIVLLPLLVLLRDGVPCPGEQMEVWGLPFSLCGSSCEAAGSSRLVASHWERS